MLISWRRKICKSYSDPFWFLFPSSSVSPIPCQQKKECFAFFTSRLDTDSKKTAGSLIPDSGISATRLSQRDPVGFPSHSHEEVGFLENYLDTSTGMKSCQCFRLGFLGEDDAVFGLKFFCFNEWNFNTYRKLRFYKIAP